MPQSAAAGLACYIYLPNSGAGKVFVILLFSE